jgi:hypothetical protein
LSLFFPQGSLTSPLTTSGLLNFIPLKIMKGRGNKLADKLHKPISLRAPHNKAIALIKTSHSEILPLKSHNID